MILIVEVIVTFCSTKLIKKAFSFPNYLFKYVWLAKRDQMVLRLQFCNVGCNVSSICVYVIVRQDIPISITCLVFSD